MLTFRPYFSKQLISSLRTGIFLHEADAPQSSLSLLLLLRRAWIHLRLQEFQSVGQVVP